ncbi:MAG: transposase [Pirellulales bacterium]
MSRTRYRIFNDRYPHFMTDTIVAWLPVFSRPNLAKIILDSWQFLQRERGVLIFGYVIMENHVHWIASGDDLADHVKRFKSYAARRIIDEIEQCGYQTLLQELHYFKLRHKIDQRHQLWQEGSHPQQIENDEMMLQKLEYTHNNPLRRGYVDDPLHWRYSSARNYARMPGVIDVVTDWG